MTFNEKTDRMDWKDELVWLAISAVSGLLLWLVFFYFGRFSDFNQPLVLCFSIAGFYILSILVRIQNHRGRAVTAKTSFPEEKLKWLFPLLGFLIGLALLLF